MTTVATALTWASAQIAASEARQLLAALLACSRAQLVTRAEADLSEATHQQFADWVQQRVRGRPIAYLLGQREFFGLSLMVDERVLIPRHETELLVELAQELAPRNSRVLDLGTGSGAVALALKHQRADLQIVAADVDWDALACAQANAARLGLPVQWVHSDWGRALSEQEAFALIVSNPPYIAAADPHLQRGDCRFEPPHALTDLSVDGLDAIRQITRYAQAQTRTATWLLLEHGYDQAAAVRDLLDRSGAQQVQSWRDLAAVERVSGGLLRALL